MSVGIMAPIAGLGRFESSPVHLTDGMVPRREKPEQTQRPDSGDRAMRAT